MEQRVPTGQGVPMGQLVQEQPQPLPAPPGPLPARTLTTAGTRPASTCPPAASPSPPGGTGAGRAPRRSPGSPRAPLGTPRPTSLPWGSCRGTKQGGDNAWVAAPRHRLAGSQGPRPHLKRVCWPSPQVTLQGAQRDQRLQEQGGGGQGRWVQRRRPPRHVQLLQPWWWVLPGTQPWPWASVHSQCAGGTQPPSCSSVPAGGWHRCGGTPGWAALCVRVCTRVCVRVSCVCTVHSPASSWTCPDPSVGASAVRTRRCLPAPRRTEPR